MGLWVDWGLGLTGVCAGGAIEFESKKREEFMDVSLAIKQGASYEIWGLTSRIAPFEKDASHTGCLKLVLRV
eukprot:1233784-Rhodomonas_salina.1